MNRENVLYCIQLMKHATNLNMIDWQRGDGRTICNIANTVSDLHECGNTACFAGYVAISNRFQDDGGIRAAFGIPIFNNEYGEVAIAEWLNISRSNAVALCLGHYDIGPVGLSESHFSPVYGKIWKDVTPEDVIEKLQRLLDGQDL